MFVRALLSFYPARLPAFPGNLPSLIIPARLSRVPFERDARPSRKSNYSRTSAIPGGGGYTGFLVRPIRIVSKSFDSPPDQISVRKSFVSPTYAKNRGATLWKMSARRHFLATRSPCLPPVRDRAVTSHQSPSGWLPRSTYAILYVTFAEDPALMMKRFKDLSEKEIVAVAIANEAEDGRIYGEFADALRDSYPATAEIFEGMRVEEAGHRDRLLALFRQRFGDHIPPIRREDVRGFLSRRPVWMMRPLGVKVARRQAEIMEMEASRFYSRAASLTTDAPLRELLNMLADEERKHTRAAGEYEEKHLTEKAKSDESESHKRLFMLQFVQPGLAGLMDGSVSTLAPLFAAAFATH